MAIFDHIEDTTNVQATPAQLDMLCKIFTSLLKAYMKPLGESLVLKTFKLSKATVENEYPFVEQFTIDDDFTIRGNVVVDPQLLAQGMARWLDLIHESFSTFLGKESETIAKKVLSDYRFALKSLHFFEHSKIKV